MEAMTMEKTTELIDGVTIDKKIAEHIMRKILFDEKINLRTNEKTSTEMVQQHIKTIKEAINAY